MLKNLKNGVNGSDSMINVRKYVLYGWLGFATPAVVIVNGVAALLPMSKRRVIARGMARFWARGMLRTTGARCHIDGLENIPESGPFIVMSNHCSHLDTPVLIQNLPFLFGFIVKEELMKIPIFSGAMKTIGCVAVSRGKGKGDHSVLDGVARDVAGGKNILIFPEGTRSASPEMLPFKKGGAIVAIKSGVPILPIGLSGTGRIIPARVLRVTAGDVRMKVGKPIQTEGLTLEDRDDLTARVRAAIEALYDNDYGS
ncbi:MAG: lysophospholipid acyltransferase family protein [Myxococcota bacterium]|nr:lysophospholipid acyltransferase family protein [Myxococcota bacterium]